MGSTTRSASVRRLPVVEGLEGRTLLSSAWVGTWNVDITNVKFQSNGGNGDLKVEKITDTVVITQTGPGQFRLSAGQAPYDFQIDLMGTEDWLQGGWKGRIDNNGKYSDDVFRLRRFEGNVVSVFESRIDYTSTGKKKITGAELIGGFAAQAGTSLTFPSFPWEGTFTAQSTNVDAGAISINAFDSTVADQGQKVTITPIDGQSGVYTVATAGYPDDTHQWGLNDTGNKLVYRYDGVSDGGSAYTRQFDALIQGPGGRWFYLGGEAEFNTMSGFMGEYNRTYAVGQVRNVWLGSGYTDAFKAAPVLTADPATPMRLTTINEDARNNTGTTIATLIASSGVDSITDPNQGAKEGIALTSVASSIGKWQYSTDSGATWINVGIVSDASALLLGSSTQNRLRLVQARDYFGTTEDAITFRAWDQSGRSNNGARVDVSDNGGARPYSAAAATASIRVKAVNDAPVLSAPATIVLSGALMNKNFAITFDTLATAIQTALLTYSDVDNTHDSLGFQIKALSGTLKVGGITATSPVLLMPTESFAWRAATNVKGRITALQVRILDDGKLTSAAFVTVLIKVV